MSGMESKVHRRSKRTAPKTKRKESYHFFNPHVWTHKEKKALLTALQQHGFNDTEVLAKEVGTRTRSEVEHFIDKWTFKLCKRQKTEMNMNRLFAPKMGRNCLTVENFPPIALWKKVAQSVMKLKLRHSDYSQVFAELFGKFEEEEPICDKPDMPNFKETYKFLHDLLNGSNPAMLSPLGSFTSLLLMDEAAKFIENHDLSEEIKFAKAYSGPTRFAPAVKMEKQEMNSDEDINENIKFEGFVDSTPCTSTECTGEIEETLSLPTYIFEDVVRHVKIKENLNPLLTHVYLLHGEQKMIKEHVQGLPL